MIHLINPANSKIILSTDKKNEGHAVTNAGFLNVTEQVIIKEEEETFIVSPIMGMNTITGILVVEIVYWQSRLLSFFIKMKISVLLIALTSLFFLSFSPIEKISNVFTTNCNQTFHFFFLSQGSPVFWIGEDLNGECEYSKLLHISINSDSTISVSESWLKDYSAWGNIPELKSLFQIYEEQPLTLEKSIWMNEDLKIVPPDRDSLLFEEYSQHLMEGGSNALSWYEAKGNRGIKLPKLEGVKAELLFSYKTGLYINYEISEVHYFPKNYLLIFTHQPAKGIGLDTMHGFFIFKIISDE